MTTTAISHAADIKITTKRADDKAEIKIDAGKTVLSIRSPTGIGHAVLERTNATWRQPIVLRLHLKGLESLRISNGKVTVAAAVSSQPAKPRVRLWRDNKEDESLDAKSPYWMDIRMLGRDGRPQDSIPLADGYFEAQLPAALLEGNPPTITISWIDFYR